MHGFVTLCCVQLVTVQLQAVVTLQDRAIQLPEVFQESTSQTFAADSCARYNWAVQIASGSWTDSASGGFQDLPEDAPVLILLPGLTGGSHDSYVRHMVGTARRWGIRAVCFNSRGTSTGPVLTPQFYSASFTGDMRCA